MLYRIIKLNLIVLYYTSSVVGSMDIHKEVP